MGNETWLYGRIVAPRWLPPKNDELFKRNLERLNQLPDKDEFPWLTRHMFSTFLDHQQHIYRNQVIHFGADYKSLEWEWHLFINKFENLLRQLYWFDVVLHLEGVGIGEQVYTWYLDYEKHPPDENNPQPTTQWIFEGGPRTFLDKLTL